MIYLIPNLFIKISGHMRLKRVPFVLVWRNLDIFTPIFLVHFANLISLFSNFLRFFDSLTLLIAFHFHLDSLILQRKLRKRGKGVSIKQKIYAFQWVAFEIHEVILWQMISWLDTYFWRTGFATSSSFFISLYFCWIAVIPMCLSLANFNAICRSDCL